MVRRSILLAGLAVAALAGPSARADLVGPYTADANTLFLLHFDGAAGTSVVPNLGSKGRNFYSVSEAAASTTPPVVTDMLGAPGYVNGATNFNTCMTNSAVGYLFGYDANNSGAYDGGQSGSALSADALAMTNLNIGLGGQSPFTIEALIQPTTITSGNQEIIATDSDAGSRAFQFRITSAGQLNFQFINGGQAISGTIPTTGPHAFVANTWYHVAISYDGATATLYWTKLDPANGAANVLSTAAIALGTTQGNTTGPLCIGNENRNVAGERFAGCIDEVRISNVARGSGQMQFFSPLVTITKHPVSQNVDYNQPVAFEVAASSQFPLGYQWRFNTNAIAGATNTLYVISNVAAAHAGYYDCVVTNTIGYAATSSPARLVVGAANFLANRYSFTNDTSDSIGGQWGTNYGNANISGGKLVLDGTTGTFMELPGNLFNGGNATALTVEFWATYGSNPSWAYTFAFGVTNYVIGSGIVGFNHAMYCAHTGSGGQTASATPGDPLFAQTVSAPGTLDGQTVHVAVVFDPPNKQLLIYTNGVLETVNTNFTVNLSSLNDQLSFIGRSLWENDPYLNAAIDEIRIFRGALSPITIKQSQDQGPDVLLADGPVKFIKQPISAAVPVGWPATFVVTTVGYLPITYQWSSNGVPVTGATNASFTLPAVQLANNGTTFSCTASNTIGVTTYFTNSTAATLSVFTPPTFVWLDAPNGGADSQWNISSLNWSNVAGGGGVVAFAQTNAALLDSRGVNSPTVDLTQEITPYTVTVNASTDYMLTSSGGTGFLSGPAAILKQGSGKLTIDVSNTLSGGVTIAAGSVQVGNGGSSGSLGSGEIVNNGVLAFNRSDAGLAVTRAIHGSGSLQFNGAGTVTLTSSNDFTGSTTINAGILNLQNGSGLGTAGSGTTVASGGQLYFTANQDIVGEAFTLNGIGDANGALRKGGAGFSALTGPVALASDTTIGLDGGATLALSNVVSGAAVLTLNGGGTIAMDANNTYTGGTILEGAIVNVNANRALGPGAVTIAGAGRFVIGDGLTVTNSFTANAASPGTATGLFMVNDNTNGSVTTLSGPLVLNTLAANGGHFAGPTSSGYLNIAGPVTMPGAGGGYILMVRLGNLRFSGASTGYDSLEVRSETTSLGVDNAIATTASLDLAGNGSATVPTYLDLNGHNQTLAGLKNTVAPANLGVVTNSGARKTLTLDLLGGSQTFSGYLAGNLNLTLLSGTQAITGTNAYSGNTTVSGGLLQLAVPSLAAASTVTVANGAMLQLDFVGTNKVSALVLGGVSQAAGVYSSSTSPTFLAGPGALQVQPVVVTPTNITAVISGNSLNLSWPGSHLGWVLQAQTNSLNTGLTANWVDVAGSGASTQAVININPANPTAFFRLRSP